MVSTKDKAIPRTTSTGITKMSKSEHPESTTAALSPIEEREDSPEQRESISDERCSETCEREAAAAASDDLGASSVLRKRRRAAAVEPGSPSKEGHGSNEASRMTKVSSTVDASQTFNYASLGTNSFGNMSFLATVPSNVSNNVDLGEPFANISMSQDQAWEILNQDSFGFNLGQGTLSLSFSNDADDHLVLPYSEGVASRVNELTMDNALDGSDGDLKKSIDLTTAITESLDGPGTPSKATASDDGKAKKNSFYPHGFDGMGFIPPTPPSTQSAPMSSSLPRGENRHRSRRSSHRSSKEGARDYDCSTQDLGQTKSEEYYYDRPRPHFRSTGGKRSGTRSSSRRHRKAYHRSREPIASGSPPPLPNMGSAPSPMNNDSMGSYAPDSKRYKIGRESSRSARYSHDGKIPRAVAGHSWHPGPIRPNARYPQSPSNVVPSPSTRSHSGATSSAPPSVPSMHMGYSPHGYPYHSPASYHPMRNHLPHPSGNNGESGQRSFLPPPPPQFTDSKSESSNPNVPPREVYIPLSSSNNATSGNPKQSPRYHSQPPPGHNPPPSLPPPHTRGPYHLYPTVPIHSNMSVGRRHTGQPLKGESLLGSLTREQAPGIGWPSDEDVLLTECMTNHKSPLNWEEIAREHGRGRTARECHDRWTRYLKPGARKGQWREDEDAVVLRAIAQSAEPAFTQWADLAPQLPGRSGKQIRDRWVNYLNPAINHLPFSREDDLRLWEGHKKLGKRWVEISVKVFNSTRSENHIKNRWYSAAFKKFIANEFGPNAYVHTKAGEEV